MKILIVEDNPTNMKLVALLVEKADYSVLKATDAAAGIAMARKEHPDLILMDIQLPGMDGLTATDILKGGLPHGIFLLSHLPRLRWTGTGRRCWPGGVMDTLASPLTVTSL